MKISKSPLIIVLSLLFMFTIACQEESTISSPEQVSDGLENILDKKNKASQKPNSVSQLITVKNGGKLKLDLTLKGEFLGQKIKKKVKFSAEIRFSPGTVLKDETFTMTLDLNTGMISFFPQMDFMKTVPLKISVKGVDLKKMKIQEEDINFAYLDAAGDIYSLETDKVWFKKDSFGIKEVEIPHFNKFGFPDIMKFEPPQPSRYGFSR